MNISEIIRRYASYLVLGDLNSTVDGLVKQMEGYFSLGFRDEVYKDVKFKEILMNLVPDGSDAGLSYAVLEGSVWRFITGEEEVPVHKRKERDLGDVSKRIRLWKEGYGYSIEVILEGFLKRKLSSMRLVAPSEFKGVIENILYDESGKLTKENYSIFDKIRKDLTTFLAYQVKSKLMSSRSRVLVREKEKTTDEVLEPHSEGIKQERISPLWVGPDVDVEVYDKFVKENYPHYMYMIFDNVLSNEPLSDKKMGEKIKKETGKEYSRQDINKTRLKLFSDIRDYFFPGVTKKKPVDVSDVKFKDLDKEQADDFRDYLKGVMKKKETKGSTEETAKNVLETFEGVLRGDPLKSIAKKLGIPENSVYSHTSRHIIPAYVEWIKGRVKEGSVRGKRFIQAMEVIVDYDEIGMDYDKIGAVDEFTSQEKLDDIKKKIQERLLDKKEYNVKIVFESRYDWKDIGLNKFHPEKDTEGDWVKDDPKFNWKSFDVVLDRSYKLGQQEIQVKYSFKQPLTAVGSIDKGMTSSLVITKGGEDFLHVAGKAYIKDFLDAYFVKLAQGEIPILKGSGISVKYFNSELDREYHNTHEFMDQMGGIGFSNSGHRNKAEEYQAFLRKRKEHKLGPGRVLDEKVDPVKMKNFLKGILLNKDISSDDKIKVNHYLDILKKEKKMDAGEFHLKLHEMNEFEKDYWKKEHEKTKDVSIFDAIDTEDKGN